MDRLLSSFERLNNRSNIFYPKSVTTDLGGGSTLYIRGFHVSRDVDTLHEDRSGYKRFWQRGVFNGLHNPWPVPQDAYLVVPGNSNDVFICFLRKFVVRAVAFEWLKAWGADDFTYELPVWDEVDTNLSGKNLNVLAANGFGLDASIKAIATLDQIYGNYEFIDQTEA